MTTINSIGDLVRILKEQPEWADTIRGILLSEELLNLPSQFAEFVRVTQEHNQLINQRLDRLEVGLERVETRLDQLEVRFGTLEGRVGTLEGRVGNLEGSDYERKVRYRILARAQRRFGLENAYLALTQNDPEAPQLSSAVARAINAGSITPEQSEDLHDTDIIISAQGNRHVAVEVSMTADEFDVERAKRRAAILRTVTDGTVTPVVITANPAGVKQDQAAEQEVAAFVIQYP
jgi:septal ring factor EnvC (AmiA/AmiB activator)